ncbi:S1C family serine protease [Halobellus sp. EA9]|uniref:S1C family serine protease n=1 Tax=Halobellus sp. EA9 TaxID=3421647 RepID=UPI003EB8F88D
MGRTVLAVAVAVLMLTAGCQGFVGGTADSRSSTGSGGGISPSTPAPAASPATPAESTTPHAPLTTTRNVRAAHTVGPAAPDSYRRLYRHTIDSVVKIKVVRTTGGIATGSGFVYDAQGRIVTNRHVVRRAETVMVRFRNGEWAIGEVIGTDVYTDLAVIDVDGRPSFATPLPITNGSVRPGEPVVALGSPFGLEGTITHGIVSGVNRSMPTNLGFTIPDTIQTDAPINPGNSGGPLLSLNGTVVGVNRATRGDNVGFAISADVLRRVVPALVERGSFHHPYLGVRTETVTPIIAAANGLSETRGAIVTELLPNSPASGIVRPAATEYTDAGRAIPVGGDIVVRIDGRTIQTRQELARYLLLHTRPGESVSLTVLRNGRRHKLTVQLARRPEYSDG